MGGDHEYDPLHEIDKEVSRCADALERIADALETSKRIESLEQGLRTAVAIIGDVDYRALPHLAEQRASEIAELEKLLKKPG